MAKRKLKIEYISVEKLVPYINNPRENSDAVGPVASSIASEFDFNSPIAVTKDNVIINGHTRFLAAKKLGLSEVPCVVCDHLTEAQIKAYRLADNRVAEFSHWDSDRLRIELDELGELDFGEVPGFDDGFFDALEVPERTHTLASRSDDVQDDVATADEDRTDETTGERCPRCGYPL